MDLILTILLLVVGASACASTYFYGRASGIRQGRAAFAAWQSAYKADMDRMVADMNAAVDRAVREGHGG